VPLGEGLGWGGIDLSVRDDVLHHFMKNRRSLIYWLKARSSNILLCLSLSIVDFFACTCLAPLNRSIDADFSQQ